jgi:hypothetical protein
VLAGDSRRIDNVDNVARILHDERADDHHDSS